MRGHNGLKHTPIAFRCQVPAQPLLHSYLVKTGRFLR